MTLILTMILVISESVILYLDRFDKVQNQMCPEWHSINLVPSSYYPAQSESQI